MTDVLDMVMPFLLAFMSLAAFQLGSMIRQRVHVIVPLKDPVTLILFLAAFSPAIAAYFGFVLFDVTNVWYLAFLLAFVLCYSFSYMKGEFGLIYVNVHTIISEQWPDGVQEIDPIVYYYGNDDGALYLQEQSFKEILKTVVLGIRSPLDFPMGQMQRTKPLVIHKIFFPEIRVDAADVVMKEVEEEEIVKLKFFKFKVRSYKYTPAPSCLASPTSYIVSAWNQKNQQAEIVRLNSQLFETKVTSQSQFYAGAGDLLIELVNDRTPGADVYQEIARELDPGPEPSAPVEQIQQANRRRPLIRRRKKNEEPEEEEIEVEEE